MDASTNSRFAPVCAASFATLLVQAKMKLRYFIPLLLVSALVLMLIYTLLLGVAASASFRFMHGQSGVGKFLILRAFPVVASVAGGVMALPLGYVAQRRSSMYGFAVAILGILVVINPWNDQALSMLWTCLPEYTAYVLSCWTFWRLGAVLRRGIPSPNQASHATSEPAPGAASSSREG